MGELPVGWCNTTVGKIAFVSSGVGFPKKFQGIIDEKYPVYKVGDVSVAFLKEKGKLDKSNNYVSPETIQEMKGQVFNVGTTLFAKIGEALKLNRRVIVKKVGLADNNVMGVKACEDGMDFFVYRFLQLYDIASLSRSTTVPSIRKGDVEEIIISLPPLNEQIRIANKLDSLLAKVEAAQTRLDRIPTLLKRFRQSVLAAATSGELTKEWRKDKEGLATKIPIPETKNDAYNVWSDTSSNELPEGWVYAQLGALGEIQGGGTPRKSKEEYWDGDIIWVSPKDMKVDFISNSKLKITTNGLNNSTTKLIPAKSVIFVVRGMILAHSFPVGLNTVEITINQDMKCLIPNKFSLSEYLLYALKALQSIFVDLASSSTHGTKRLQSKHYLNIAIPIPSLEEQKQIVQQVESLFTLADKVEKHYQQARLRTDKLTQSLLAKAFKGELVPQDPNDEPAKKLLARIQAERKKLKPAKKSRKAL